MHIGRCSGSCRLLQPHTEVVAARADLPVEDLARRYWAGSSLRELAEHFNSSVATVRARLRTAGIELRRRGAPRLEVDLPELVYETHLTGSVRAAARALGVDRGTAAAASTNSIGRHRRRVRRAAELRETVLRTT